MSEIDELLRGHQFAGDAQFRESLAAMMQDNPQRQPGDLLFIATAIYQTTQKATVALETARAQIVATERARIRDIVGYGLDNDCWLDALNLALTTELPVADAVEILVSRKPADDVIRPN